LGLPCELVALPFPPRIHEKAFFAINPLGTVPALVDGAATLTESSAIAHYLATRDGPTSLAVSPGEADYGCFLDFLHHADATLTFPQTVYLRFVRFAPDDSLAPAGEAYAEWFTKRLVKATQRLESHLYLAADRFTVADIAVGYALYLATLIGLRDQLPAVLLEYLERTTSRPAFGRALEREGKAGVLF
jgi:glutathione S-transferase